MTKIMFKPFFKRFFGLFISMVFVSLLSISLLIAFASAIGNLNQSFKSYLRDYDNVDMMVTTKFVKDDELQSITNLEAIKGIDTRATLDIFLTNNNRTTASKIISYDEEGLLIKPYVIESAEHSENLINISLVRKYANNNNLSVGDIVKLGYLGITIDCYVEQIVETAETIQVRANEVVWSDNTDYGYIYVSEKELNKAVYRLSISIEEKIKSDEKLKEAYLKLVNSTGYSIPDLADSIIIGNNFVSKYKNQILIDVKEEFTNEIAKAQIEEFLKDVKSFNGKDDVLKQIRTEDQFLYVIYMKNCLKQLRVAAIFLPVFFYTVTMLIIVLFMNQIIKQMTPDIGIMVSIGVGKKDIRKIFLAFSLVMSITAGILGIIVGILLNNKLSSVMINVYSIPVLQSSINPVVAILAVLLLLIFSELATMISCKAIFKITPKDAIISNEAKRKKLPPKVEKMLEKAPMNMQLGINSIFQNPRRFFISIFSIFASFVIILLSLSFNASKNELMDQTVKRRLAFDCQTYLAEKESEDFINELKSQSFITAFEDCYYTYFELEGKKGKIYLECLAYDHNSENDLVNIPSSNGKKIINIEENGIIIPKTVAKELGVKKGDKLVINNVEVLISDVSYQYFHPVAYLSKVQMNKITDQYVSSFLSNVSDQDAFLDYMSKNKMGCINVFTSNLQKDLEDIFNSINIFIYIMIGFSMGMGFIILAIMSQNALMEQKRQLSVFRLVGFRIIDVSNIWTLQSLTQLFLSTILALPLGALFSGILFGMCSSTNQVYPLRYSSWIIFTAFLFILIIILLSHLISMYSIKRWNLANNTRSRE